MLESTSDRSTNPGGAWLSIGDTDGVGVGETVVSEVFAGAVVATGVEEGPAHAESASNPMAAASRRTRIIWTVYHLAGSPVPGRPHTGIPLAVPFI